MGPGLGENYEDSGGGSLEKEPDNGHPRTGTGSSQWGRRAQAGGHLAGQSGAHSSPDGSSLSCAREQTSRTLASPTILNGISSELLLQGFTVGQQLPAAAPPRHHQQLKLDLTTSSIPQRHLRHATRQLFPSLPRPPLQLLPPPTFPAPPTRLRSRMIAPPSPPSPILQPRDTRRNGQI